MPLDYTGVAAGSQARSAQLKQVLDLLTGVMTDQPVTFKSNTYGVLDLDTVAAATKQGLRLRDGGAIKWELFKETDLSFNLWDTVGGIAALKFASNGGAVGTLGGLAFAAGLGLPGATTGGMRFVGTTPAGPPLTGTFAVGDFIYDMTMFGRWVCITAGTPGTWVALEGAITSPKAPTVVVNVTGTTSWWYKVVTEGKNGSTFYDAIPSAAVKITNGAVSPNNTINWTAPIGVDAARVAYVVLRSSDGITYSRIAFPGVGVLTFTDNNASAVAYTAATVNPGGGRVITAGALYRAAATQSVTQADSNAVVTLLSLGTVEYDPHGDYDNSAGNYHYTCPVAGFYVHRAAVLIPNNTTGDRGLQAYKNGALYRTLAQQTTSNAAGNPELSGSTESYCAAGDILDTRFSAPGVTAGVVSSGYAQYTYMGS